MAYTDTLPEPKHTIVIHKWNVVGYNRVLRNEAVLDNKHKVLFFLGTKFLNIQKINGKPLNKINDITVSKVITILKEIYDDLTVISQK